MCVLCSCSELPSNAPSVSPTTIVPTVAPSDVPTNSPTDDCPCFVVGDVCVETSAMDILFVLDISTSADDWESLKTSLAAISFPEDTRVAVATYATTATLHVSFDDQTELASQILAIPYTGGASWSLTSLNSLYEEVWAE
eukprot:UN25789